MIDSAAREAVQNLRAQGASPMTEEQCSAAYTVGIREANGGFSYSPHELCVSVANEYYNQEASQQSGNGSGIIPKQLIEVEESLEIRAINAVSRDLKDPSSAQFRDIFGVQQLRGGDRVTVCGSVNAKNAYGGYVGYKPFSYTDGSVFIAGQPGSIESDLVKLACVDGVQ
ncbi:MULTISPECIES: hypothetical protein [unclassified Halomonas]|uniref:hypothetical protein n=1 Tax=unclassified Halomonas TaxID=2609666 RepID=UPI0020767758|nr:MULTISPECIES: hypothetical protein [unclassified Halomonas]